MKKKHLAGTAAITLILLLSLGCKLGNVYIQVSTERSMDAAISRAESYKERKMDSQVFRGTDNLYHVTIGPYLKETQAKSIRNQKIAEGVIPPTAEVVSSVKSKGWQMVYPKTGTIPKPPGSGSPPPSTTPPPPGSGVRKEVQKDVDNKMKDDFKVYPPDKNK